MPAVAQERPGNRSSFRIVRFLALCSVLAILIPWYAFIFIDPVLDRTGFLIPVFFAPLWGPWAWVCLRLTPPLDSFSYKRAIALSISWAMLAFIVAVAIMALMISSPGTDWRTIAALGGFGVLQLSLVFASIKAYYSMQRETGDREIFFWRAGIAGSILLALVLVPPYLVRSKVVPPEASAIASLRDINVAQSIYANTYPDKGFAASLQGLGPSPGAELIDRVLASGIRSGYTITMYAPPDPQGRISRYTLIARPQRFGKDGTRSFLTDESGLFHVTSENRPPTRQDPLL
jgi:hypothetical protein